MELERIETPGIAHLSYLIGDSGEAAVVDPRRDVDVYLRAARDRGLTIRWVVETHRQEDFVVGAASLARALGARIVTGVHPLFGRTDVRLDDGEELRVGRLALRAIATPGHTPESTCYAVFAPDAPDLAWAVLTGDTLLLGSTGRTDLTDSPTGTCAGMLYDAVHESLAPLGDQALVLPAHAPGSVCGGGGASWPLSTLGLERRSNPVFLQSRDAFVQAKKAESLPRPPWFDDVARINLDGGAHLPAWRVRVLQLRDFREAMRDAVVIDTRQPSAWAGGHIPGSYNVWRGGLGVFGGWVARRDQRVLLVLDDTSDLDAAVLTLARLGVDAVDGTLAGGFEAWRDAGLPLDTAATLAPQQLAEDLRGWTILDVREPSEVQGGRIPGARHIYVGHLEPELDALRADWPADTPIAVTCSVGHRAGLAASILARGGFTRVANLLGGMSAWQARGLPVARGE